MTAAEPVEVTSRSMLRRWLQEHHAQPQGIWLVTWKKDHGRKHVPYDAIVEEALCFGWIDSQPRSLDADRSMRLLSPRRPGSAWSRVNKDRIESLMRRGLMTDAGMAKVRAARADGSWNRLDAVETLDVPADLEAALRKHPPAPQHFMAFPPSTRRAILEWIFNAKMDATRRKRIEETAEKAAQNIRANQYRQPKSGR